MCFYAFSLRCPEAWHGLCFHGEGFVFWNFMICGSGFVAEFSCMIVLLVWGSVFCLAEFLSMMRHSAKMLYLFFNWISGLIESISLILFILVTGGESDRDSDCLLAVTILNFESSLCLHFVAVVHEEVLPAVAQAWFVAVSTVLRLPWSLQGEIQLLGIWGRGIKTLNFLEFMVRVSYDSRDYRMFRFSNYVSVTNFYILTRF